MTQRVTADAFQDTHIVRCALNGFLQAGLKDVVSLLGMAARIDTQFLSGK